MSTERLTIDVSRLPGYAFGHRSLMWWGTLGLIVIEGMMFAILAVTYFYLSSRSQQWPPVEEPPRLLYGTINTIVILISAIPNHWYKLAAEKEELKKVQIGLIISIIIGLIFTVIRIFEFPALNCKWDSNAYGSIVWMLMGFHTAHLLTDLVDTVVLTVLMFTDKVSGKRFSDVSENAFYWWFVVLVWIPIYVIVYWVPRWMF
ncbi:MAG TPA: cytochrome c oxidase subunit 3 [Blastocatellia bacterium]|nr:cytochrome c oxidase subunit 3 [Blastocatellia bacterium]